MSNVTQILFAIEQGEPQAAEKLLPLVYEELRILAAHKMSHESSGGSLQPTALVHEAYVRLVDTEKAQHWDSRGHFFAAAAEAMRRILVERARRKRSLKQGGDRKFVQLDQCEPAAPDRSGELLEIHEALDELAQCDAQAAELVKLRYFAGLEHQEAAAALGISRRAADRLWASARVWLFERINNEEGH